MATESNKIALVVFVGVSLGLFKVMELLGKEKTVTRLKQAAKLAKG